MTTVVISGATKGVGRACVDAFIEHYQSLNLVAVARNKQELAQLAAELSDNLQVNLLTLAIDVSSLEGCQNLVTQTISEFGAIDILVNNAGLHHRGDLAKLAPLQAAQMVDLNLRSPIYLSALALPHMSSGSAIIMVGSLAGKAPLQGAATYSATKAGLRAFSFALGDELRTKGIKVAVVSPGPIDTGFIMDEIDQVEDIVYSQPMSSAEQVAANIVKLCFDKNQEIAMPAASGKLATLGYLFPKFRRLIRPLLYKIGRNNKLKYKKA
ncbi:SDR family oxidoreductase [Paraferrimonas sp. SM1919]|uniref:SDR family NAD(P)-dependent oxidoreductase n=1 Tax=Paraferrimonas sp. SM1919 TaxID=2662263 RepID=UPI0013D27989|nr:SDR family NAD(P)-dependent oxidoreductase [Paraferrimonas sp. SM1919]